MNTSSACPTVSLVRIEAIRFLPKPSFGSAFGVPLTGGVDVHQATTAWARAHGVPSGWEFRETDVGSWRFERGRLRAVATDSPWGTVVSVSVTEGEVDAAAIERVRRDFGGGPTLQQGIAGSGVVYLVPTGAEMAWCLGEGWWLIAAGTTASAGGVKWQA